MKYREGILPSTPNFVAVSHCDTAVRDVAQQYVHLIYEAKWRVRLRRLKIMLALSCLPRDDRDFVYSDQLLYNILEVYPILMQVQLRVF